MNLRNVRSTYGLTATGVASRTGASGDVALGSSGGNDFPPSSALILGSLVISGITNTASPVLNLQTMMVTENGATSTDEGVTFEGRPMNLLLIKDILIERLDAANIYTLTVTGDAGTTIKLKAQSHTKMGINPAQIFGLFDDTQFTFTSSGASTGSQVRITFLGNGS